MKHRRLNIVALVLIAIFYYMGQKIAQLPIELPLSPFIVAMMIIVFIIGWLLLYRLYPNVYSKPWYIAYAWLGSILFGFWGAFLLFAIPFDIVLLLAPSFGIPPDTLAEIEEKGMLAIFIWTTITATAGWLQARSGPRVDHIEIPFPNLCSELRNLRIVQISDLHIGPTIRRRYVENVVNKVKALSPDIIVFTGDLADGSPEILKNELAPLGELKAPHGVFFATGNHDYYSGALDWIATLEGFGFHCLINEHRLLPIGNAKLMIAGITDPTGPLFLSDHRSNISQAASCSEQSDLKILLAHRPNACVAASKAGFDLQLSGHTHAGQFVPFHLLVRLAHRFYRGLGRFDQLWVYVNRGTGYWGPPQRFLIPAEISEITLI